jgi:regulator of protease activity HflC (stomatin/prohibitin superfamily)
LFFLVALPVLLIAAAAAWVIGGGITRNSTSEGDKTFGRYVRGFGVAISAFLILLTGACSSFATVDNGHIGILKEFGPVVGTTGDGIVVKKPWQKLHEVSVQNEVRTYNMTNEGDNAIGSAVSSDTQEIFVKLIVDYSLLQSHAVELFKITNGHYIERKLDPAVPQIVKSITAKYKAIQIATNREKIRGEIHDALNAELEPQGIRINVVSLPNFSPTKTLLNAIEETVQAEQNTAREQAKVALLKAQADQAIETARGVAQSNLVKANAEAQAIRAQGAALRANPEVLSLRSIEKLNPNVQVIYTPPNATIFLPGNK